MNDDSARDAIVEAADRLFDARGIRAVGMDDIRDAAGVPLKQVYRLFQSKEVLAQHVLSEKAEAALVLLQDAAARAAGPREALLEVFDVIAGWTTGPEYRGCPFLNTFAEMGATSPTLAAIARRQKQALESLLAGLVRDLGGPVAMSGQMLVLLNGAMATSAVLGSPTPALQAKAAAQTLLDAADL